MFSFLKVKKQESRGFGYKPRYFDSEKESFVRKSKVENKELDRDSTNKEFVKHKIKEDLRHAKDSYRREHRGLWQGSNWRLLGIIIFLLFLSYFILNKFLPLLLGIIFNE
jgi:hypothetical protein